MWPNSYLDLKKVANLIVDLWQLHKRSVLCNIPHWNPLHAPLDQLPIVYLCYSLLHVERAEESRIHNLAMIIYCIYNLKSCCGISHLLCCSQWLFCNLLPSHSQWCGSWKSIALPSRNRALHFDGLCLTTAYSVAPHKLCAEVGHSV